MSETVQVGDTLTVRGEVWRVVNRRQPRQTRVFHIYEGDTVEAIKDWAREEDEYWVTIEGVASDYWKLGGPNKIIGFACPIGEMEPLENEYGEVSP